MKSLCFLYVISINLYDDKTVSSINYNWAVSLSFVKLVPSFSIAILPMVLQLYNGLVPKWYLSYTC